METGQDRAAASQMRKRTVVPGRISGRPSEWRKLGPSSNAVEGWSAVQAAIDPSRRSAATVESHVMRRRSRKSMTAVLTTSGSSICGKCPHWSMMTSSLSGSAWSSAWP